MLCSVDDILKKITDAHALYQLFCTQEPKKWGLDRKEQQDPESLLNHAW
jgi:hypothetical protein